MSADSQIATIDRFLQLHVWGGRAWTRTSLKATGQSVEENPSLVFSGDREIPTRGSTVPVGNEAKASFPTGMVDLRDGISRFHCNLVLYVLASLKIHPSQILHALNLIYVWSMCGNILLSSMFQ